MMDQEKFEIRAMDFMSGTMSPVEAKDFEKFLAENPEYNEQYKDLLVTWEMMENLDAPEISSQMDEAFFSMLSDEKERNKKKETKNPFWGGIFTVFRPQLAYGILLLAIGLGMGYYLSSSQQPKPIETTVSNAETEEVRQKLVLTLLEQPSANQRLQGVSEANKFENADEIVIQALLQTLNNDSNVNVRLAAIESLTNYVDNPVVRQGLVQSIPNQESPILQITLANLMVALQEKASVEPFKQLLKEKELDTTVKKRIESSIESII
ncbi:HEAT repeat domain-containing protein [Muricauda sp. CAU 1633]|uniref:HEAT repeat domain-containing protein n=1 Tax=Allomuricauda sp. CAU 1633 TaxID=2816036 RepID=UPI001A8FE9E8|nr:HEAT repeat domain-containing protein [Muricauda sp. CAU 1633]MBO0322946.1 HEAT repeat domain-containing protein [Muricauda sp. CAU 1633]